MESADDLGTNIRRVRITRGLTQDALADAAGVSRTLIAQLESAKITNPGVFRVYAIAQALGVTIEALLARPALAVAPVRAVGDDYTYAHAQAEMEARLPLVGAVPFQPMTAAQVEMYAPGFDAVGAMTVATDAAERFLSQAGDAPADWIAVSFYLSGAIASWFVSKNSRNN